MPSTELADESDRWAALLLGKSAQGILAEPLRYGPLTMEGYFEARESTLLAMAKAWPEQPDEIARLFIACGLTVDDAVSAVVRQFLRTRLDVNPVGALNTLQAIGRTLGAAFAIEDAMTTLHAVGHKSDRSSNDLDAILESAHAFMGSSEDEDAFFTGWVRTIKISPGQYGAGSFCTVAVWHLARVSSQILSEWCIENQDYQALALMVQQERLSFGNWLRIVARSKDIAVSARSERTADSKSHSEARSTEQYSALQRLTSSLDGAALREGAADLAKTDPRAVDALINMAPDPRTRFDAWLGWTLPWVQMGLCTIEHSLVVRQIESAQGTIESSVAQGGRGIWHLGIGFITDDEMIDAKWMRFIAPKLAAISPHVRDLLAKRLLLGLTEKNVDDVLDNFGIVHEAWFSNADVRSVVHMRTERSGATCTSGLLVNIALLPWLNKKYWPVIGAQVAQACDDSAVAAKTVRGKWKSVSPKLFGAPIPSEYQGGALVLYALTRTDPRSLKGTLSALGCPRGSEMYRHCIADWITDKLDLGPPAATLPGMEI